MSDSTSPQPIVKPLVSNRVYDVLKSVVTVGLPALATLYFALSQLWHFPHTEAVVGTIVAVDTFLGAFLGLSSIAYNNSDAKYTGTMDVLHNPETGAKTYSLNVNPSSDIDNLHTLPDVTFKVNNNGF